MDNVENAKSSSDYVLVWYYSNVVTGPFIWATFCQYQQIQRNGVDRATTQCRLKAQLEPAAWRNSSGWYLAEIWGYASRWYLAEIWESYFLYHIMDTKFAYVLFWYLIQYVASVSPWYHSQPSIVSTFKRSQVFHWALQNILLRTQKSRIWTIFLIYSLF